ncbi:unnamed protein product [Brassica napus]|uniref:(rape) hypothetical protein n=1 Tax=Brassica napus TaxID=3708 RepID=A0A816SQ43_BRANA|nr:unnamed protein product [Brassica napus]
MAAEWLSGSFGCAEELRCFFLLFFWSPAACLCADQPSLGSVSVLLLYQAGKINGGFSVVGACARILAVGLVNCGEALRWRRVLR